MRSSIFNYLAAIRSQKPSFPCVVWSDQVLRDSYLRSSWTHEICLILSSKRASLCAGSYISSTGIREYRNAIIMCIRGRKQGNPQCGLPNRTSERLRLSFVYACALRVAEDKLRESPAKASRSKIKWRSSCRLPEVQQRKKPRRTKQPHADPKTMPSNC